MNLVCLIYPYRFNYIKVNMKTDSRFVQFFLGLEKECMEKERSRSAYIQECELVRNGF